MSMENDWTYRVTALTHRAWEAMHSNDFATASAKIDEAFALVNREGDEHHMAFVCLLALAADFTLSANAEGAASLYRRCYEVAEENRSRLHMANALRGIAEAELASSRRDGVQDRLQAAWALVEREPGKEAAEVRADIRQLLSALYH